MTVFTGREEDHLRTVLRGPDALRAPALDPKLNQCAVHEVGWDGPSGCWCCSDGVPGVKTN